MFDGEVLLSAARRMRESKEEGTGVSGLVIWQVYCLYDNPLSTWYCPKSYRVDHPDKSWFILLESPQPAYPDPINRGVKLSDFLLVAHPPWVAHIWR